MATGTRKLAQNDLLTWTGTQQTEDSQQHATQEKQTQADFLWVTDLHLQSDQHQQLLPDSSRQISELGTQGDSSLPPWLCSISKILGTASLDWRRRHNSQSLAQRQTRSNSQTAFGTNLFYCSIRIVSIYSRSRRRGSTMEFEGITQRAASQLRRRVSRGTHLATGI